MSSWTVVRFGVPLYGYCSDYYLLLGGILSYISWPKIGCWSFLRVQLPVLLGY